MRHAKNLSCRALGCLNGVSLSLRLWCETLTVSDFRGCQKFEARICVDGKQKRKSLGSFDDEEDAAHAYDECVMFIYMMRPCPAAALQGIVE